MIKFYLSLIILFLSQAIIAQENKPSFSPVKLDSMVRVIQETYELPGLAVGIMLDNEVYYAKGVGVQGLDSKSPLTKSSLFHMASVSKPFVATAIAQLVEAGKMDLDDKLTDHLPYFKMKDKRFRKITIRNMLNHTSGIHDVEDYEWDNPQFDDGAAERYSKSFSEDMLDFKPGKSFNYSNAAFDILADVIAKVSGLTFEDYMTKHIFEPAGMKNSTFYKPDVPKQLATQPHGAGDNLQMEVLSTYPYNRIHAPSSTLHSNIEDMTQWAMLYLNRGEINGTQVFSETTYELLTSPTKKVNKQMDMCLSWFTLEIDGKRIYYHTGGDEGYRTFFGFFPEEKAALILMGNNEYFQTQSVAAYLIKNLITNQPRPWKKFIHFELKNLILTEGIDSCKSHYHYLKENFSDEYDFGADYLDELGYFLLDREKKQEALDIFLFNVELFPQESGFYDSVGDAYIAMENEAKAIEWYEKALELNPKQGFTKEKLEKLKNRS